jgi:hypothetical protein
MTQRTDLPHKPALHGFPFFGTCGSDRRPLRRRRNFRDADYGPYRYNSLTAFPDFCGVREPRFSAVRAGVAYKF